MRDAMKMLAKAYEEELLKRLEHYRRMRPRDRAVLIGVAMLSLFTAMFLILTLAVGFSI